MFKRKVEGAQELIYKSLKVAGLNWDEGPDVGGNFEDVFKVGIFKEYALKLVQAGKAYRCFCSKERRKT